MFDADPFDPERFRLSVNPSGPSTPQRPKRGDVPFARTPLPCLIDRQWDAIYPPRTRLWLYLLIKSRGGRNSVRLTNQKAAEIGLDRYAKARALAHLRRAEFVAVEQRGKEAPVVTVLAL